jgi:hypothetical protein
MALAGGRAETVLSFMHDLGVIETKDEVQAPPGNARQLVADAVTWLFGPREQLPRAAVRGE